MYRGRRAIRATTNKRMGITHKIYPAGIACLGTVVTYGCLLGDRQLVRYVAGKERLFEDLGALLFLASSVVAFMALAVARQRPSGAFSRRRRACYWLLGIFFFVAFGEELSWGQQVMRFSTPESISSINRQGELNLHNLEILDSHSPTGRKTGLAALLTSNRLFDYFMILAFVVLPVADRLSAGRLGERGVPVASPWLALPLALNVAFTIAAESWLVVDVFSHLAVSETREFNYALLCFIGGCMLFSAQRRLAR